MSAPTRLKPARQRARPGLLERPINARIYRSAWIFVALPLLLAAFTVSRQQALTAPTLRPAFDPLAALDSATEYARNYPDRAPGSAASENARKWVSEQMVAFGFHPELDRFSARIPALGRVELTNVAVRVQGRSPTTIVVVAHRDNRGEGAGGGANDNASGTAALLELARAYGEPSRPIPPRKPAHTIIFLSTDGGSFGAIGAERFARRMASEGHTAAVIVLDSIGGHGKPRIVITGETARSPSGVLVETAAQLLRDQPGGGFKRASSLHQLIDLAFPFSLYEQAPFVARGIPAITITTAGDRPPDPLNDSPERLSREHIAAIGRVSEQLLAALDQGVPEPKSDASSYIYLGGRFVRGWTIQLTLLVCLFPAFAVTTDLFARCRRRHISLRPASRSLGRRAGYWLFLLGLFLAFAFIGLWPRGGPWPISPDSEAVSNLPLTSLVFFVAIAFGAWFIARERLLPKQIAASPEEVLAGYTVAMVAACLIALIVIAFNRYAVLFLLPPLHAWIWLPRVRQARVWIRLGVFALGLAGPGLLIWSFATRLQLGTSAPWYLAELAAVGYVTLPFLLVSSAFCATAAQLAALCVERYAPYPEQKDRPDRGLVRRTVQALALGARFSRQLRKTAPPRSNRG